MNYPLKCIYRGQRMRVLEYLGNNSFRILGNGDVTYRLHRSQFTFIH